MYKVRWTKIDAEIARKWPATGNPVFAGVPSYFCGVTPYFLKPTFFGLANAQSFTPGASIEIDQFKAMAFTISPDYLKRFLPDKTSTLQPALNPQRGWLDTPKEIVDAIKAGTIKTIEDLCKQLYIMDNVKFPVDIYGPRILNRRGGPNWYSDKFHNLSRLLFDWHENDEWRYTLIDESGKFTWKEMYYTDVWKTPVMAGSAIIRKVLGFRGVTVSVPNNSGNAAAGSVPELNRKIRSHLFEINSAVYEANGLKESIEKEARTRFEYTSTLAATEAALWGMTQSLSQNQHTIDLHNLANELYTKAKAKLETLPYGKLTDETPRLAEEPALRIAMEKVFGVPRDLREKLDEKTGVIVSKLIVDIAFKSLLAEWLLLVLREESSDQDNTKLWDEICWSFESGAEMLLKASGDNFDLFSRTTKITIDKYLDDIFDKESFLRRLANVDTPLGAVSSVITNLARTGLSLVGNFNSPLSLTVCLYRVTIDGMIGRTSILRFDLKKTAMSEMWHWIFDRIGFLVSDKAKELYWEWKGALQSRDYVRAKQIADEVLNPKIDFFERSYAGDDPTDQMSMQTSKAFKGMVLCFQLISTSYLLAETWEVWGKANDENYSKEKVLQAVIATAFLAEQIVQTGTYTLELALDYGIITEKFIAMSTIARWNRGLGGAGAAISAAMYACSAYTAYKAGKNWECMYNASGTAANTYLAYTIVALGGATASVPMLVALTAVALVNVWGLVRGILYVTNKGIEHIFSAAKSSPVHLAMFGDSEVGPILTRFEAKLAEEVALPRIPNSSWILFRITDIGIPDSLIVKLTGEPLPMDMGLLRYRSSVQLI